MDSLLIRNIADLGTTFVLAYLLLVLGPRAGSRIESLFKWTVETALTELRAARSENLTALRVVANEACKFQVVPKREKPDEPIYMPAGPPAIAGGVVVTHPEPFRPA